jgi:DNA-binding transcriptional MerR regulator
VTDTPSLSIHALCEATGISRRTVRYYIQLGLLMPPAGETRSATYSPAHVRRLREIQAARQAGMTLQEIQARLARDEGLAPAAGPLPAPQLWLHQPLAPGVELHVDLQAVPLSRLQLQELAGLLAAHLQSYLQANSESQET